MIDMKWLRYTINVRVLACPHARTCLAIIVGVGYRDFIGCDRGNSKEKGEKPEPCPSADHGGRWEKKGEC